MIVEMRDRHDLEAAHDAQHFRALRRTGEEARSGDCESLANPSKQHREQLARFRVPDPDSPVKATRKDTTAITGIRDRSKRAGVFVEGANEPPCIRLPHFQLAVIAAGYHALT